MDSSESSHQSSQGELRRESAAGSPGQLHPLRYFDVIGMVFVAVLLTSNILAQKPIRLGPFTFTAGILLFPVAYVFGDVLTEVYGYARSRRVIWTGFACNGLLVAALALAVWLPPAEGWDLQREFAVTLGFVPRIVLASTMAYWVGEFSNSYVLAKMKVWTNGRHLWARTIGSTVVGEGLDTVVFACVAFAGVWPWALVFSAALSGWVFKVFYEVAVTPATYWLVSTLKAHEGVDVYDRETRFNPFVFDIE